MRIRSSAMGARALRRRAPRRRRRRRARRRLSAGGSDGVRRTAARARHRRRSSCCRPTTTDARIERGRDASPRGYVYYVSLKGVTGAGHLDIADVAREARRKSAALSAAGRRRLRHPRCRDRAGDRRACRCGRDRQPHHHRDRARPAAEAASRAGAFIATIGGRSTRAKSSRTALGRRVMRSTA